jgi:hypothetical protein
MFVMMVLVRIYVLWDVMQCAVVSVSRGLKVTQCLDLEVFDVST